MYDPNANSMQNQGQDPVSAYSSLDSDKRSLVAQAFIQRFAGQNDPQAQLYGQLDPSSVSPGQLAEMHQYAAQNHPQILNEVMQHPVVTDNLGGFASSELNNQGLGGNNPMGSSGDTGGALP